MWRLRVIITSLILAAALSAFTPGTDHDLMNASSGPIVLDIRSSGDKPITDLRLVPGYSVGFNGIFSYLRVRTSSGKTRVFSEQQITQLRGRVPEKGLWLIEDSGLRCVAQRQYNLAYRRFHKLWP